MAKTKTKTAAKKMSKTAAIREALKSSKNGSPTEIAAQLNKAGVKVTPAYVSTIKASDKRKSQQGYGGRKPGRPATNGRTTPTEDLKEASDLMLKAVELVLKAGPKEAKQLVTMAEQVVDKVNR